MINFAWMMNFKRISSFFCFLLLLLSTAYAQQLGEWNQKDDKGQKTGKWRDFYSEGALRYQGQFAHDKPVGTFTYYYRTGKVKSILRYRKDESSFAEYYYETGELMAEGKYVEQQKDSVWTTYGAGNIKLEKGGYIAGKKYGIWYTFYPNGQVAEEVTFENDLEEGPYKSYFENGTIKQEGAYERGLLEGLCTHYKEDGSKYLKGKYYKGSRDGRWIYYKERLEVDKVLEYEKGKLLNPEVLELFENDTEMYKNNVKDELDVEDLKGKIRYD